MTSTRQAACGHGTVHARDLCAKCYYAARYAEKREHVRLVGATYRAANREKIARRVKEWKTANADRVRATSQLYYLENSEQFAERNRQWRAENPDRHRVSEAARRAHRAGTAATLTADEWASILEEFDYRCAYCNAGDLLLEQEHMTPLSRGGAHTFANVVPACGPCNRSKYTKTALEWIGPEFKVSA